MLGDYRGKYTLWRGDDQWCQALKFGSQCCNLLAFKFRDTIGHHQGGCQQHNISGALSRAVRKLRAIFFVIGALVGCKGEAIVPLPDGWNIGARPIDLHVRGLEALGAQVEIRDD